jgi:hypothetical protein
MCCFIIQLFTISSILCSLLGASLLKTLLASFCRLTKAYAKEHPDAQNLKELNFIQEAIDDANPSFDAKTAAYVKIVFHDAEKMCISFNLSLATYYQVVLHISK